MHFWSQQPLAEAASTPMRAMAQRIRFEGGCEGGVQRVLLGAEAAEVPLRSALPGMVTKGDVTRRGWSTSVAGPHPAIPWRDPSVRTLRISTAD